MQLLTAKNAPAAAAEIDRQIAEDDKKRRG